VVNTGEADYVDKIRRFLTHDLWRTDLSTSRLTASAVRFLQFWVMVGQGFLRDRLLLQASALTYMAILSVIPALTVALSVVKAVGVSENLAEFAVGQLAAGSPEAKEQILRILSEANIGGLGTLSAAILLVTTVLALRSGEQAFNEIWGVRKGRTLMRRFADYLAIMIVVPLFTAVALSLSTTLQAEPLVAQLLQYPVFAQLYQLGLGQLPTLLMSAAFCFSYWFLPNTQVKVSSAVVGGVFAALLFLLAQRLYVDFSIGAARANALFGGMAALPLLLVWIYTSMAIVLLGVEVSFAFQNLAHYRRSVRGAAPGPAEQEAVGMRVAVEIARAFRDRQVATEDWLSDSLDVPMRSLRDLLQQLEAADIVAARAGDERIIPYQLGRPAEDITIGDVLVALRGPRRPEDGHEQAPTAQAVGSVLADIERCVAPVADGRTLADVLETVPRST
jgi:membrane protein